MRLGVISLGGESSLNIVREAGNYFDGAENIDIRTLEVHASSEGLNVLCLNKPIRNFDCIYIRGSHKYAMLQRAVSRAFLGEVYLPLKPSSFEVCHNKFFTLLELQKAGINIPKTYFAATTKSAKKILEDVSYPIIMKIPSGTQGKGVMMADSLKAAKTMLDALEVFKQPYIIQEYIETDSTDIRALVIGNKVIGMKRMASFEEMRANIHAGAKGVAYSADANIEQLALKSAKVVGADICAVDILEGRNPAVIEVNPSPGLGGITKATKINIANIISKYLAERTKEFLDKKKSNENGSTLDSLRLKKKKEIFTALDIKHGMIRLPKFVTDLGEFTMNDEVVIVVDKGKIEIRESKIPKNY